MTYSSHFLFFKEDFIKVSKITTDIKDLQNEPQTNDLRHPNACI